MPFDAIGDRWGRSGSAVARPRPGIPPGVALDQRGEPTTDPKAVLDGGALLPFGGHKGGAIAVTVELLAAVLTGGHFGFEEASRPKPPGAATAETGQFVLLIDPRATSGGEGAALRVEALLAALAAAGAWRIPGEGRAAARAAAASRGVPLAAAALAELEGWAAGPDPA